MIKKVPLLPNAITAFGLTCGLYVIFKVNMVDAGESTYFSVLIAAALLLIAAVADLLDGAVARAMKVETDFGSLFDTMADAITFGVAPSVLVMKTLSVEPGTQLAFFVTSSAIIFSMCGVLRLVRFSMADMQAKGSEQLMQAHKKNFTGLPIPAGAAAAVAANLFLISPQFGEWMQITNEQRAITLSCLMIILGYFMISRWKFPSVKTLQIRVTSFQLVFVLVLCAMAIFYGIRYHFPLVFLVVSWGYLILGWVLSVARVLAGRRTKSLEDYEPEPEEVD